MKVFLLGADGFIGRHIAFSLKNAGHTVVASARNPVALGRMGFLTFKADLTGETDWQLALHGCDIVVNAAGLLNGPEAKMKKMHSESPAKIYAAAKAVGLQKIVLISAVGIEAKTAFARHRKAGEAAALAADIPCVILRPSLVLGDTSYGGSSLIRGLSILPFFMPVIGDGKQVFDPIHADDLAKVVLQAIETDQLNQKTLSPCGPERVTQIGIIKAYRTWLGRPKARVFKLPIKVARGLGWLGDRLKLGPISTAAVEQLETGVGASFEDFKLASGQSPQSFTAMLANRPAGTQDLWHARLYLLRPMIRFSLMIMWLISGLVGLFLPAEQFLSGLSAVPLDGAILTIAARLAGGLDMAIALGLLLAWRLPSLALVQLTMVGTYTLAFGLLAPELWLEPYGGLLKNIPIIGLILAHKILEEER